VRVRSVRPGEYAVSANLIVSAYAALPGGHLSDDYAQLLSDVSRRAMEAEVLVALDPNVIGCVTFVPDATSPWAEGLRPGESGIRMLAVDPHAQGRGAGRALVGACVERARRLGHTGIFLSSAPWMRTAHHLYEKSGFVRVPERDWVPVPEVRLLAFRLDLDSG
jgi:predicted N-acetyltransferase YhbS